MATSGRVSGNTVSIGGGSGYIFTDWQLSSQSIGGNSSVINYQTYFHFNVADAQLDNGTTNVYGVGDVWRNGGRIHNPSSYTTHDVLLASGSFTVYHGSDGYFRLGVSTSVDVYYSGTSYGYSEWDLPLIPRQANITSAVDFNDEGNPVVGYSNPAGNSVTQLQLAIYNTAGNVAYAGYRDISKTGSSYTFNLTSTERTALLSAMASSNSKTVRFYLKTVLGGNTYLSYVDRTVTVVNANPIFSTVTYEDSNSATVAITGDNQTLIQGFSTLLAKIASADKATAQKYATMVKYNFAISSISLDENYVTTAINKALGVVNVNSDTNLVVSAIDSRNNSTPVTKLVKVLPYVAPAITPTVARVNNFETETHISIASVFSRLTVSDVDKNTVHATTGIKYRYKKTTDAIGAWSSWIDKTATVSNGNANVAEFSVNLDRNYSWNIEFSVTDKLQTVTTAVILPVGIPIFRIGTDGKVYNNEQPLMRTHVGQIIFSATLDTAVKVQAEYGGTWVAWGTGKMPVGVDIGQTEFNTVGKTGGTKTHTLSTGEMPAHSHQGYISGGGSVAHDLLGYGWDGATARPYPATTVVGGGSAHNNLPPYETCYMWKRTL